MTRLHTVLLTTTALAALGLASAVAGPDGANVVGGSATVHGQGSASVTINQSSERAIINWRQFDIGAGETTRFNQPSSSSVALNRVTGGLGPSQIMGTLSANGRVFVVNRDGILFGPNSKIDTAGFLATTNDIRNDDFMAGRYHFNIPGRPDASIVNHGTITAHSAGFAALVAPGVRNTGTITATLGTVGLASGNGFTLDFYGDRLITLAVGDSSGTTVRDVQTGQPLNSLVENAGRIQANGGRVELTAVEARRVVDSVINNRGVVEATTVGTRGGTIVLGAATTRSAESPRQTVRVGGTLSAAAPKGTKGAKIKDGSGEGGRVIVTGENIEVAGARIDVSGPARGGTVLIGGDWGGGNPNRGAVLHANAQLENQAIPTAATVMVDSATVIDASATESGNAGKVIVWADGATSFRGSVLATGGQYGGDGGFVEVSGRQYLDFAGQVNARAPRGQMGTLLLDPENHTIWDGVGNPPPGSRTVNTDLQNLLANQNVVIETNNAINPQGQNGDIFVNASVTWSAPTTLTLSAFRNVDLATGATITTSGGGNLVLRADNTGTGAGVGSARGTVIFQRTSGPQVFASNGGNVSIYFNPTSYLPASSTPFTNNVSVSTGSTLTQNMLVSNVIDLQNIATNLAGTYALGRDINVGGTMLPIGSLSTPFSGTLDGLGHNISDVTVLATGLNDNNVGMFAAIGNGGVVRNLDLANINIQAGANQQFIGALAGNSAGMIANVNVSGSITNPNGFSGIIAGGVVGQTASNATVTNATSSATVSVGNASTGSMMNTAGGVVGVNAGTLSNSSASGAISGGDNTFIGGLVGNSSGSITSSSASGAVSITSNSGDTSSAAGGFVGANTGTISHSNASGAVSGQATQGPTVILGGFVGLNGLTGSGPPTGNITESHATGNVSATGNGQVGGFVGGNFAMINLSTATGQVSTQQGMAGGFVGFNSVEGSIDAAQASGTNSVTSGGTAGGFVGENQGEIVNSSSTRPVSVSTPTLADLTAGGFAGGNSGTITNSSASGPVSGTGELVLLGGFVGSNEGTITGASASGNVSGSGLFATIGGFAGANDDGGQILNSSTTGNVTGTGEIVFAGGFAGGNLGFIDPSSASGNVNVSGATFAIAGGFVGFNVGPITNATASGNVTGGDGSFLGGLVGWNLGGNITHSSASSIVTGGHNSFVGGLVSLNLLGGISESFATGPVTGGNGSVVGGLVASNLGSIEGSFAQGAVTTGNNGVAGGLVGVNLGIDSSALAGLLPSVPGAPAQAALLEPGTIRYAYATGAVTGGADSTVGGLIAANGGPIDQAYSTGFVQGGSGSTAGGLIAVNNAAFTVPGFTIPGFTPGTEVFPTQNGTATNSYWDTQSSGQASSAAGSGRTTAQFAAGLPGGFDPAVWSINAGVTYPFFFLLGGAVPPLGPLPPPPDVPPDVPSSPPDVPSSPPVVPSSPPVDDLIRNILPPPSSLVVASLTQTTDTNPTTQGEVVNTTQATQTTQNQPRGNQRPQGNQQGTNGPLRPDGRPSNIPPLNETRFINDQVVVQIGAGISPDVLNRIARRLGLSVIASETLGLLGTRMIQFRIGSGRSVREVLLELEKQRIVDEATPNYEFTLAQDATSDAPAGDPAQYMIAKLNLAAAHRIATGDNVLIAVIDSEIDSKHPDLEGRIANRFDAVGPADKPHPHGTGMAGAIASRKKLMGTAPGARILAIRAFGTGAGGSQGTTVQIVKGLDWAISQGAKIVNMSFAGPKDPTLAKAFKAATDRKVVLIAAAGNAGPKSPPLFPGAETGVIAVTATDADDAVYTNANRGKYVTVAAPGVDILVPAPEGGYEFTTGTSVAAAHVSGVAALLLQRDPKLDPATLREILTSTAKQLGKTQGGRNDETGSGLVDPFKALQSLGARSAGVATPGAVAARN